MHEMYMQNAQSHNVSTSTRNEISNFLIDYIQYIKTILIMYLLAVEFRIGLVINTPR